MDKLLTQDDLAERWQVSKKTIEKYRLEGTIKPIEGIPSIRFNPRYIEEIEGSIPEAKTWVEIKLGKKVEALEEENRTLRQKLAQINMMCTS